MAALLLGLIVAPPAGGDWHRLAALDNGTVQIQDGAGNVPDSLTPGDNIVVFIQDASLGGSSTGKATWTNIPEQVQAFDVWNLATGSPHPSVHTLSASGYDTAAPENTPLLDGCGRGQRGAEHRLGLRLRSGVLRIALRRERGERLGGDVHLRRYRLVLSLGPSAQGDEHVRPGRRVGRRVRGRQRDGLEFECYLRPLPRRGGSQRRRLFLRVGRRQGLGERRRRGDRHVPQARRSSGPHPPAASRFRADADAHAHGHAYTHAHSYADAHAHRHADANAHGHAYA